MRFSRIRLIAVGLLVFLPALIFLSGIRWDRTHTALAQSPSNRIAYVWYNSQSAAQRFNDFLEQNGWVADLILLRDLAETDLSIYRAIIVAEDTAWGTAWGGDGAARLAILNARRPVIGMYQGGYTFFGDLGLNIGYPNGNTATDADDIQPINPQHPLWNTPNVITPVGGAVTLYAAERDTVAVPSGVLDATNEVFGVGTGGSTNLNYLVGERKCYILWGYQGDPADMTQDGHYLFLNLMAYVGMWAQCADFGPVQGGHVAYIQAGLQDSLADRHRAFLEGIGWAVDTFPLSQLDNTDLSNYDAIILGGNTKGWTNALARFAVLKARRPVVGIYEGGYTFFGMLGLNMGAPNGSTGGQLRTVQQVVATHPIWNEPFAVLPDTDGKIRLFTASRLAIGVSSSRLDTTNTRLGAEGPGQTTDYLLGERNCFVLWGYDSDPWAMTLDGMHLFANLLRYLGDWENCTDFGPVQGGQVAYIQSGLSDSIADRFREWLQENGWAVNTFPLSQVPGADLSFYDVIILGENTGANDTWYGNIAARDAITNAHRPIIGIYQGGYSFFGTLGLNIGYPNGTTGGRLHTVIPATLNHPVWHQPFSVLRDPDGKIRLHNADQLTVGLQSSRLDADNVRIGVEGTNRDVVYLVGEKWGNQNCYVLWGYQGDPTTMTLDGMHAFINLLGFLKFSVGCEPPGDANFATLSVNHSQGAPGSYLTLKGQGFPPNGGGIVTVNGVRVGSIQTNALGTFQFLLRFGEDMDYGLYGIVVSVNPIGKVFFGLDPGSRVWTKEDLGDMFEVPSNVPPLSRSAYLPLLMR